MKAAKSVRTSIDIPAAVRTHMVNLLNQQLADTADLYSHTKQAHWNVKGPQFYQLHELFDELAETLEGFVDSLAERATALGGAAMGTVRMAAAASRLKEFPAGATSGSEALPALVERYAALAKSTRASSEEADKAGDSSTADLFTEVSRGLDKALWFLEAHLQA